MRLTTMYRACFATILGLSAALLLLEAGPAAAELAEKVEDNRFLIERLPQKSACCPAELVYRVTDKAAGETRETLLIARVEEVRDFFLVSDSKLVVEGRLRYGGSNLLITDLRTGELEEEIWNYGHAFSPSGRFLVYRSHYPRMIPPPARRSLVMLYDLAAGPRSNRFVESPDPQKGIGLPIYPPANAERLSLDVGLARDRLWVSPFLWAQDERAVYFFECEKDWAACYLVEIGIEEEVLRGMKPPTTERVELDLYPYVRREGAWTFTGGPDDPVRLAVQSLEWAENGQGLIVYPEPASSLIDRFELPLP